MSRHAQAIRNLLRTTRLNRALQALLDGALWLQMKWNAGFGGLLVRGAKLVGSGYYDHRVSNLGGVMQWQWAERGVFATWSIPPGGRVLEIGCADGMYSSAFYATRAGQVDAIDLNPATISVARRRYPRPNVRYLVGDAFADPFPEKDYDTVCCFATLQYFSLKDLSLLLQKIGRALPQRDGAFVGSLPVYPVGMDDPGSKIRMRTADAVKALMSPHFGGVEIHATQWGRRTEVFFKCRKPRVLDEEETRRAIEEQASICETS